MNHHSDPAMCSDGLWRGALLNGRGIVATVILGLVSVGLVVAVAGSWAHRRSIWRHG